MATNVLSDFNLSTVINNTDFIVGYNNTSVNGERRWSFQTIANALGSSSNASSAIRAYVVFTYRGGLTRNKSGSIVNSPLLGAPRILSSYNIAGVTRMTNTALYVTFTVPMPNTSYCVLFGQSNTTADGLTVASNSYGLVPSEYPPESANLAGSADKPYKSTTICKFESRGAEYLNEVYLAFI